jgi:hypothetical protein
MQSLFSRLVLAMTMTSAAMIFPISSPAQSIWLDRSQEKTLALEVLRPDFKNEDDEFARSSNSGWVLFWSSRVPLSKSFHLVGELPFAFGSYKYESRGSGFRRSESESTIGNPYLGVEVGEQDIPVFVELGIRLPLASENNFLGVMTGFYTDMDRLEAFVPNMVPINVMINLHQTGANGFQFRLRGGTTLLLDTGEGEDTTEEFIGYSAQAGYRFQHLSLMAGFSGRAIVSEDDLNYGERSFHQLGFNASVRLGQWRSGLHLRLPLDEDLKEPLDAVFGAQLGVLL